MNRMENEKSKGDVFTIQSAPQRTLAAKRICEITGAERKAANAFQGELSEVFVEQKLNGKSAEEKAKVAERWEGIFQRWRKIEKVVVPYVSELFEVVAEQEPLIYKGVSYNPMITTYGENFNILDFFGWFKAGGFRGIVLNASLYAIVNAAQTPLVGVYSEQAASEAVRFLVSNKLLYPEIERSADIRDRYLRAATLSLFSPNEQQPLVIDAEMLWSSKRYIECLQEAIKFCSDDPAPDSELEIKRYANYTRYNTPYQKWYSVLVLAEALYLYDVYGVNIKLGPTTESKFDNLIREFMKGLGIRYGFVWYDRTIERQIPYPELVLFDDKKEEIEAKLKNEKLVIWILEMITPFLEDRSITRNEFVPLVTTYISLLRDMTE